MGGMINFGIDLGTTNSLIAKFEKGTVEVFPNPVGFKETLPSVVSFRKDAIMVGEKARTYAEKDPANVVSRFKRKMGTTESYPIKVLGASKTPMELSAFVLKELKTFIHTGDNPEAAVITIPASFDTIQSNATKEAGHLAGFKQVVLLQEPIAASLAYSNKVGSDLNNSQWIVYDLGGGTFDVALVRIMEGELKVLDHEGDNFLGGSDFDMAIVDEIVIPWLEAHYEFDDLESQMKSSSGSYHKAWHRLLLKAEEAKIELSANTSTAYEFDNLEDDNGETVDEELTITRSDFEEVIKDSVDRTVEMVRTILTRNSLRAQDIRFVLMVGGATYIPLVRRRVGEMLGIPVNTGINPTNAIAIGAAYFAGTKEIDLRETPPRRDAKPELIKIRAAYSRFTQENEEMFAAKVEGEINGLSYRITRGDGGYDSGVKKITPRIVEDLPLEKDTYNAFTLTVLDSANNPVRVEIDPIWIAQGRYGVAGQPLPDDICLVFDDPNTNDTRLERVFTKNTVLPVKKPVPVQVAKTLAKGSNDSLHIIVVEGPSEYHHTVNKEIGHLEIRGSTLPKDLLRGTEVDLTIEMSESRDLSVTAYINPSGPEFKEVFKPNYREVDVDLLNAEVALLENRIASALDEATANERYEESEKLDELRSSVVELRNDAQILAIDDATDDRYKLDDRKKAVAKVLYSLTSGNQIDRLREEYHEVKRETEAIVHESGNDVERRHFDELCAQEDSVLSSKNPQKWQDAITRMHRIAFQILKRKPDYLIGWFEELASRPEIYNDPLQARTFIESGRKNIEAGDFVRLEQVIWRLVSLLPEDRSDTKKLQHYTGITRA